MQKLTPVVGIETQDGKGQRRLDLGDALGHGVLAAIEHRAGSVHWVCTSVAVRLQQNSPAYFLRNAPRCLPR